MGCCYFSQNISLVIPKKKNSLWWGNSFVYVAAVVFNVGLKAVNYDLSPTFKILTSTTQSKICLKIFNPKDKQRSYMVNQTKLCEKQAKCKVHRPCQMSLIRKGPKAQH